MTTEERAKELAQDIFTEFMLDDDAEVYEITDELKERYEWELEVVGNLLLKAFTAEREAGQIALLEEINAAAEQDMLNGNPITGAHHRAIERKLKQLRKGEE